MEIGYQEYRSIKQILFVLRPLLIICWHLEKWSYMFLLIIIFILLYYWYENTFRRISPFMFWYLDTSRNSHWRCSIKEDVLKNCAKFTIKHLYQSLSFNKVVGLRPATLFKKRLCFCTSSTINVLLSFPSIFGFHKISSSH